MTEVNIQGLLGTYQVDQLVEVLQEMGEVEVVVTVDCKNFIVFLFSRNKIKSKLLVKLQRVAS